MKFKSIGEVFEALNAIPTFAASGSKAANFSLNAMLAICEVMDHPERELPIIHVAGTNGKGSVCRMLASIYQTAGYRTGLYTSPHLLRFNERYHLNGEMIPDEAMIRFFNRYWPQIQSIGLSYFEIATALGFWWFSDVNAEIVLLETGLGGRLDATNVVNPLLSIIVSIGHDHEDLLGPGLSKIAGEKAGIIKSGAPVLMGKMPKEASSEIISKAALIGSELHDLSATSYRFSNGSIEIEAPSGNISIRADGWKPVQAHNAALAIRATELLDEPLPISDKSLQEGLSETFRRYPHHGSFHQLAGGMDWYYDGGHNPEAMATTLEAMKQIAPLDQWVVVYSLMRDKVSKEFIELLMPTSQRYYVSLQSERAASFSEISLLDSNLISLGSDSMTNVEQLKPLKSELVLFTGSFYFYERVREWIDRIA